MAPRGLSAEEKRVKLVEIFHETRDFYQLKELEKLGPKLKGIGMSIVFRRRRQTRHSLSWRRYVGRPVRAYILHAHLEGFATDLWYCRSISKRQGGTPEPSGRQSRSVGQDWKLKLFLVLPQRRRNVSSWFHLLLAETLKSARTLFFSKVKNELAAAQDETTTLESKITALRAEIENEANARQDN
ncbi:hypothetical protein FRC08_017868, partial [Ceratobasidium sp. 394]